MNFKVIRLIILAVLISSTAKLVAQKTYRAEIGPSVGTSFYMGDANSKLFANQNLTFGLQYRHKFNNRLALTGEWNSTKINGKATLPDSTILLFNNPLNALDLSGEFNFFSLEDKSYKPFSQKYSTFIFGGLGGMLFDYENSPQFKLNINWGLGMKFMLGSRVNLNIKWSNRLLLSDKMEGVKELDNPLNLNGGNLLNRDLLSTINVGLTFNIFKENCDCKSFW